MSKKIIRKKLLKKRKLDYKEKQKLNFSKINRILFKKNIKKGIIGGYFPVNYEDEPFQYCGMEVTHNPFFS